MLHYEADPRSLQPLVPEGTELDRFDGRTLVSVVGFLFRNTRIRGVPIPWHRTFEEVNLRFYVRRRAEDGWRRAVVFVKELVPRRMIALVARGLYNENYVAVPMGHRVENEPAPGRRSTVVYWWGSGDRHGRLRLEARGDPRPLVEGSEAEFLAEHYWGYARQRDGGTLEYRVEHPRWRILESEHAELRCDARDLYGPALAEVLSVPPSSAFLAEGSSVSVHAARRL